MQNQIPNGWQNMRLGDVVQINSRQIDKNYPFEKIEYIDISAVGTATLESTTKYSLADAPGRAKRLIKNGDTILSTVRPNRRSFYYFKKPKDNLVVSTGFAVISSKPNITDSRFIYYLLTQKEFTHYLTSNVKGSAYPAITTDVIENAYTSLPGCDEQRKIASILSAFDDKIEINNKIAKTLEDMAQTIFKEWFIKNANNIDQISNFANLSINFDKKRKPLSSMQRLDIKGIYPYYGATEIMDYINKYIFDGEYLLIAEDGSVETSESRPVLQFINGKFWVNNHAHIVQGKDKVPTFYLYLALKNTFIRPFITGAVQLKLTQENLNRIPIPLLKEKILADFTKIVGPVFQKIRKCKKENEKLAEMRDLLLPKLMKGEIRV